MRQLAGHVSEQENPACLVLVRGRGVDANECVAGPAGARGRGAEHMAVHVLLQRSTTATPSIIIIKKSTTGTLGSARGRREPPSPAYYREPVANVADRVACPQRHGTATRIFGRREPSAGCADPALRPLACGSLPRTRSTPVQLPCPMAA